MEHLTGNKQLTLSPTQASLSSLITLHHITPKPLNKLSVFAVSNSSPFIIFYTNSSQALPTLPLKLSVKLTIGLHIANSNGQFSTLL